MLTFFDCNSAEICEKLLDAVISEKVRNNFDYDNVSVSNVSDILNDFQDRLIHQIHLKPIRKINWKKEPKIKPRMNRAYELRKNCIH